MIGWGRIRFAAATVVVTVTMYVLWARVGLMIYHDYLTDEYSGPFTTVMEPLPTLIPTLLGAMLVIGVVYSLLIAPVQEERGQTVDVRRRR